ncbi:MAG: class I mannose-6-phosphate isomerase [Actinobacteria bacterium]|nr:class I mannose-6-phosphate isomerase [Actinomycetota bacterium]
MPETGSAWRASSQRLLPHTYEAPPEGAYDLYPAHDVGPGRIRRGYEALADLLRDQPIVVVDGHPGVLWESFRGQLSQAMRSVGLRPNFIDVQQAMRPPEEIDRIIEPSMGDDDPLFGFRFAGDLRDFFDAHLLLALRPDPHWTTNVLYGGGASLAGWRGSLVYVDVPKNEIQYRARASLATNLGAGAALPPGSAYKRSYFIDWPVSARHRARLLPAIDWLVDGQDPAAPAVMSGKDLRAALREMARSCFRVRAWFEPGPWGGQWIRHKVPQLSRDVPNYAWSFELIAPENGLILRSGDQLLEVSFDTLMHQEHAAVLGECAPRFQYEFPIRYDFLDTVDGGDLSIQIHPQPDFIRENFGETFTQDEAYYILDCTPGATVNLGMQEGADIGEFRELLIDSATHGTAVDIEQYVQSLPASKHDLFLIPHGTIHGAGAGNLVLEISATPYIFTFKVYDWLRPGLDGKPRPLNIDRGFANLDPDAQGARIREEYVSAPVLLEQEAQGDRYSRVVHLPTHPRHFYDVHRLELNGTIDLQTGHSCHVLNLVEGEAVILEPASGPSVEFHHAETFVVPAAAGSYRLTSPTGADIMVVKTFVKPLADWPEGVVADARDPRREGSG